MGVSSNSIDDLIINPEVTTSTHKKKNFQKSLFSPFFRLGYFAFFTTIIYNVFWIGKKYDRSKKRQ